MSVAEYFDGLAKHGRMYRAGDANSQEALDVRWKVMAEAIPFTNPLVLEAGCGYGGFADYLVDTRAVQYLGVEVSPKQADLCRSAGHHVLGCDILDVEGQWDIVLGQGLFYKQPNYATCMRILEKMWELATHTVVVTTILDGEGDELSFRYQNLIDMADLLGCPRWTMRNDYHPNDVCLYLYK